jgi:Tfp pilus assembly protein PilV
MQHFTGMTNKLLSLGMIGILAVASMALAALFSSQTATAQMMTMQNQMMQQSNPQQQPGMNHNMFSVMGMSMVPDVRVSGVSITGDNIVSVNLTYTGNGTSPSVTVVANDIVWQ